MKPKRVIEAQAVYVTGNEIWCSTKEGIKIIRKSKEPKPKLSWKVVTNVEKTKNV